MPHSDVMSSTSCTTRCIWYYEPLCPFCDLSLQVAEACFFLKIEAGGGGGAISKVIIMYLKHIRIHGNNILRTLGVAQLERNPEISNGRLMITNILPSLKKLSANQPGNSVFCLYDLLTL